MDLENLPKEPFETNLIEEIDKKGYLVHHDDSYCESDIPDGVDINLHSHEVECNDEDILGRIFDTLDDTYMFYNRYALLHGFGTRIHWDFKNRSTNEVYRKMYVCNKQGFKKLEPNSSSGDTKKRRRDLRTGCKARLRVSKTKDNKWCVDIFDDIHNHDLSTTPTKVMKHRSHGKFHRSIACKTLMLELGQSGLGASQIKKAINAMKSPHESDLTSKQCTDILSEQRKLYRGKEFYGLIKHFQDKAMHDKNQYFVVDLFDDGSPRNIFWADGRSREDYMKFGDVVVFDVTYMTNKFKMPFAPFVGVNHHNQSILFGGALLENEKEETFQWLFEHFLKCMFMKYPSAIITDQDKAICNAIWKVFPNTRHRFCAWHIKKHELEHLRSFKARYSDFKDSYKEWVKSDTVEEFETKWDFIRGKYDLESSSWMMDMYNQRKFWVKAFLKDIFLAGMTTSGRSESIHSFFDGYINSKTMLNEFAIQFDKAVISRRAAEEDEDFKTVNSMPVLSSVHPVEAKAGKYYTRKIFELFKKEWTEATKNVTHETLSKSEEQITYMVGQVNVEKKFWRIVRFHLLDKVDVTCSCAKFETFGILCKHILYVMKKKHAETLPDYYILPRWKLDARYKVGNGSIRLQNINENEVSAFNLWCVQSNCTKAIEQARDSPAEIKRLNTMVVKFLDEQMIRKKPTEIENANKDQCVRISEIDMMPQICIRDPVVLTKTKGRPKNANRIKSSVELVKKKRTCSYCNGLGHNITGCTKKKEAANSSLGK